MGENEEAFNKDVTKWMKKCVRSAIHANNLPVFKDAVQLFRSGLMQLALQHGGSRTGAAKLLNLNRTTLCMQMKERLVSMTSSWFVTLELDEKIDDCLECPCFRNMRCIVGKFNIENPEAKQPLCRIKAQVPACVER